MQSTKLSVALLLACLMPEAAGDPVLCPLTDTYYAQELSHGWRYLTLVGNPPLFKSHYWSTPVAPFQFKVEFYNCYYAICMQLKNSATFNGNKYLLADKDNNIKTDKSLSTIVDSHAVYIGGVKHHYSDRDWMLEFVQISFYDQTLRVETPHGKVLTHHQWIAGTGFEWFLFPYVSGSGGSGSGMGSGGGNSGKRRKRDTGSTRCTSRWCIKPPVSECDDCDATVTSPEQSETDQNETPDFTVYRFEFFAKPGRDHVPAVAFKSGNGPSYIHVDVDETGHVIANKALDVDGSRLSYQQVRFKDYHDERRKIQSTEFLNQTLRDERLYLLEGFEESGYQLKLAIDQDFYLALLHRSEGDPVFLITQMPAKAISELNFDFTFNVPPAPSPDRIKYPPVPKGSDDVPESQEEQ